MNADQRTLLKASELIERHGWIQRSYGDARHGYCLLGAISHAAGDYPYIIRPVALTKILGAPNMWNDDPRRTKEEVIDVLIAAAYGDWT